MADWAGIQFIEDIVTSIDPSTQQISLHKYSNGSTNLCLKYDILSIDIGSTSRGLHVIPGVKKHTIPTRPISNLLDKIQEEEEIIVKMKESKDVNWKKKVNLVVIGAGLAGIELALVMRERWKKILQDDVFETTILNSGRGLIPNESEWCRDALKHILKERNIKIQHNCNVESIDEDMIHLINGEHIPYTHCLWATGAEPHQLAWELDRKGIAVNQNGWIRVGPTLQTVSHPNVFAAGDCASIESANFETPPKAGVYAVRSGPILIENISKTLEDLDDCKSLVSYQPQDDFLKLITCGDGTALGFRFGIPLEGKWVWQMKDRIDQMFMDLFQVEHLPVLDEDHGSYNTSQYDERTTRPEPLKPEEAKELLLRKDDNVDYERAWDVIRDMMDDEKYKEKVLDHAYLTKKCSV